MMSLHSQSTGASRTRVEGERRALLPTHVVHASDVVGQRRLVDCQDRRSGLRQQPRPTARAGAEVEAGLPRPRPATHPHERLVQLEVRATRRAFTVLDQLRLAVRKRARAVAGREHQVGFEQCPRPERRVRHGRTDRHRLGRHRRQLLGDQPRSSTVERRVQRPVALTITQLLGGVTDRRDRDLLDVAPHVGRPHRLHRFVCTDHQSPVRMLRDAPAGRRHLVAQLVLEVDGCEVAGEAHLGHPVHAVTLVPRRPPRRAR